MPYRSTPLPVHVGPDDLYYDVLYLSMRHNVNILSTTNDAQVWPGGISRTRPVGCALYTTPLADRA